MRNGQFVRRADHFLRLIGPRKKNEGVLGGMTYTHTQEGSMLYRNAFTLAFACMLGVTGCRDNGTLTPADLSMGGSGGGGGGGTAGGDMATAVTYTPSTIAMMRMNTTPGTYELDNVVAIALTPSSKSPKMVVQDAGGGDYSAIQILCPAMSAKYPCTVQSTIHTIAVGHKVTVTGTFIQDKMASGGGEQFYVTGTITDNGAGTAPAPLARDEKAIQQATDATVAGFSKDFWQMVTVTPSENLVMYDWTPATLKYSGTWPGCSTAPFVFGFAMAPASAALTATAACTTKTMPAPSQATPDGRQIYIGTDYYTSFQVSSDCQCAKTPTTVPAAGTQWPMGMPMTGILGYDTPIPGTATTGYKYFSPIPATPGAGALTGTVAPPAT
jgi:hypothetical protein